MNKPHRMFRSLKRFRVALRRWWRGGDDWYVVACIPNHEDTHKAELFNVRGASSANRKAQQWEQNWIYGEARVFRQSKIILSRSSKEWGGIVQ